MKSVFRFINQSVNSLCEINSGTINDVYHSIIIFTIDDFDNISQYKCTICHLYGLNNFLIEKKEKEKLDDDYHECARPCSDESSWKKTCVYQFFVTESHGAAR